MADRNYINKTFKQQENICVVASYATVIEYYSSEVRKINGILDDYVKAFNLNLSKFGKKVTVKKHKNISIHYHSHCNSRNMRGFDFIVELHNGNQLETNAYCQIIFANAQLQRVADSEIDKIRSEIINNGALAMILYKVKDNLFHAVTIGFDSENNSYLLKDPEKSKIENEDILSTKEIFEYIVFNDYDQFNYI